MANKRQKEARKRFRGASDGAANAEPAKKELKEAKEANGRQLKNKVQNKPLKLKKHPLRVAGNKPGDGCFMCKSKDHVAKFCPQKTDLKICLLCRERGHTLKHCPSDDKEHAEAKLCYNCGETGHRLAQCTKPLKDGGTSFAECFLCKQRGHISKNCSLNSHGIYPKGGSCKLCGEVTHLAKDCPSKTNANGKTQKMKLQISKDVAPAGEKRLVFKSGDDLEDDFEEF